MSARHSLPCSAANLTCIAPGFLQQLGLQISAFHFRTYQVTEPLLPGMKGGGGDRYVSVLPHNRLLSPRGILGLCVLPSSNRWSSFNPSSSPQRSILSFHTPADAPGSYISSQQQDCDIASTAASSPEPLRPRGHPERPPSADVQCSPSIPCFADHHLPASHLPTPLMIRQCPQYRRCCNSLVYPLGMPAALADHMFTAILVVDQDSTIGTSSYRRNSRAINPLP